MKLFVTGPSPDVDLVSARLRAKGHEVVIRPPQGITISCTDHLCTGDGARLAEDVIAARGQPAPRGFSPNPREGTAPHGGQNLTLAWAAS